jgi:hypothetical protein
MLLLRRSQRDTLWIMPLPGLGDSPRQALAAQAADGPVSQAFADGVGEQMAGRHCPLYPIDANISNCNLTGGSASPLVRQASLVLLLG